MSAEVTNAPVVTAVEDGTATSELEVESHTSSHLIFNEGVIIIFIMLMIYMAFEAFKHKKQLTFGHEASLVTLIGFGISYAYQAAGQKEFAQMMQFSDDLFFYFCLPPIVFASGFNMQRKKFFENIRNIMIFGLFGTFIAFISFTVMTIVYKDYIADGKMTKVDGETGEVSILEMSTVEVIIMCSLLCSTDVIAAVSLINPEKQPKLFSLVFGEGITNDAVSIILFNTVVNFSKRSQSITAGSTVEIAADFATLGFKSIAVGIVVAILASITLKKVRALTKTPVSECAMLFSFAYVSYVLAELWHISGIITLLTCSIVMANYAWYNLSPQGKQSSVVIFKFLGFLAECFVFSYLGLTFFSYKTFDWSTELIMVEFVIILIGRALGTFGLVSLLKCCGYEKNNPRRITWKELTFIWYAGLIRGAIAFGLVLRIDIGLPNRSVIVTTCLTLVVVSTIFFGSTVGLLGKFLFSDSTEKKEEAEVIAEEASDNQSMSSHSSLSSRSSVSSKSSQVYQPLLHYNEKSESAGSQSQLDESKDAKQKKKTTCADYFKRFDQFIMRPILIHKYEKDKDSRAREFYEMFQEDGPALRKIFNEQQKTHQLATPSGMSQKESDHGKDDMLKAAKTVLFKRRASRRGTEDGLDHGSNRGSKTSNRGSFTSGLIVPTINEDKLEEEENL